jgi:hypothetical protein
MSKKYPHFDAMNALQRRLHNAACVLDADGDEYGYVAAIREAVIALSIQQEADAKDAARYRFMRDPMISSRQYAQIQHAIESFDGDKLDEAIDRVIASKY